MMSTIPRNVTPCSLLRVHLRHGDGGSTLPRNVDALISDYSASHHRTVRSQLSDALEFNLLSRSCDRYFILGGHKFRVMFHINLIKRNQNYFPIAVLVFIFLFTPNAIEFFRNVGFLPEDGGRF